MKIKNPLVAIVMLSAAVSVSHGDTTVQELFDGAGLDATITGQGAAFTSSIGFNSSSTWLANGTYGNRIYTANNFDVDYSLPGAAFSAGSKGGVYFNVWSGGGATWDTDIYTTRQLATPIDFSLSQTVYFSVRLNNSGDTAMGFGLASGANGSAEFVGAGLTWNGATGLDTVDAANSLYLSAGTLDQNLGGNNKGPYAILAHTAAGSVDGPALLVGRLTLAATGNDLVDVKMYKAGDTVDTDPSAVSWSLQGGIASSMSASHLLLWLNGNGTGEVDAIRLGTTWVDVIPEPSSALLGGLGVLLLAVIRRRR